MKVSELFPLSVAEGEGPIRLDQFLSASASEVSRSRWSRLIESGAIQVDGVVCDKPSFKLKSGACVELVPLERARDILREIEGALGGGEAPALPETVEFRGEEPEVIFEDAEMAVLHKPCGLTVHPGAGVPLEETVAGWLLATGRLDRRQEGDSIEDWEDELVAQGRSGIVHRLDRGTSGLLVVAKTAAAHAELSRQFATREAGRLYWAVVEGDFAAFPQKRGQRLEDFLRRAPSPIALRARTMEGSGERVVSFANRLERDPRERLRFRVSPGETGKRAVTHFIRISSNDRLTLLECKLETGRTHQIRVHCSFLDFPILGDGLYGGTAESRMWLHAHALSLSHPKTGEAMSFAAPWPEKDAARLASWGLESSSRGEAWKELKSSSPKAGPED